MDKSIDLLKNLLGLIFLLCTVKTKKIPKMTYWLNISITSKAK